jgi:hypothetical protein
MQTTQHNFINLHNLPECFGMAGLRPYVTKQSPKSAVSRLVIIDECCLSITNEQFNTYASDLGMT